mmetsp:Transcript_18355/g.51156  ORF Transcript_18355/g.51156 Transcript_18355/m.51156 type:complete len:204 (+) Transcript_18355:1631-2242(+)
MDAGVGISAGRFQDALGSHGPCLAVRQQALKVLHVGSFVVNDVVVIVAFVVVATAAAPPVQSAVLFPQDSQKVPPGALVEGIDARTLFEGKVGLGTGGSKGQGAVPALALVRHEPALVPGRVVADVVLDQRSDNFQFPFPRRLVVDRHQKPLPVGPGMVVLCVLPQDQSNVGKFVVQEFPGTVGFQQSPSVVPNLVVLGIAPS